ncbi:MAG: sialate O-acetylesterase [Clostridia bacterium]|nr:sialate O-acetylesterase [Clostridia bacterium]
MSLAKEFKVSGVFSDNMVLQRDSEVRIWGFAPEAENGKSVKAEILGVFGSAVIENGEFLITLEDTLPLCKDGAELTVYGDGKEVKFNNVLVGDVYYVIGQSNVRFPLEAIINGAPDGYPGKDCVVTDSERIRLNRSSIHDADGNDIYPVRGTTEVCPDVRHNRKWELPSEGAMAFSALGFFIARELIRATDNEIPIGMIELDADGQALNAFMSNSLAEALGTDRLEDGVYKGMWHVDYQPSRYVYNQFMYPYLNCSVKGIIWYQGESDFNDINRPVFVKNYKAYIEDLRKTFAGNGEIPVFMVEIPSCYGPYDGFDGEIWAYIDMAGIRCEMGRLPNCLDDCYIAASSDLWLDDRYWNSLHPYCKYPQAHRIAKMMLARLYGIGSMESAAAPQFTRVEYCQNTARIFYRYTESGLTTAKSSDLIGFEVKVGGKWLAPSLASVADDTVILNADGRIEGVRYNAVTDYSFPKNVNLCSGSKLPAIAFIDEI